MRDLLPYHRRRPSDGPAGQLLGLFAVLVGVFGIGLDVRSQVVDGALQFVEVHKDGVAGARGLFDVDAVVVAPDGGHLYATSGNGDSIAVYARDVETGALAYLDSVVDGDGAVDGLGGAFAVAASPDGAHLYVASALDNAVAVFARSPELTFIEAHRDGVAGVDGLDGAGALTVSPDGAHVYVAGAEDDAVAVFARDPASGALTFVGMSRDGVDAADGLDFPQSLAVSPDGAHLYAAGFGEDAVAAFSRDAGTGVLTFVEVERDGVAGVEGLDGITSVAVSPDGNHVYTGSFFDDSVAVFSRDSSTGALTYVEHHRDGDGAGVVDGLDGIDSVSLSPDGANLYAASEGDDAVAVFTRDAGTGALDFVEAHRDGVGDVDGLDGAAFVTVSPGGDSVYVAGLADDAVAVFARDGDTGALSFVEHLRDGVGGVDGLDRVLALTVTPDGSNLYAVGSSDNALAAFSRDSTTGALTFLTLRQDGAGGVTGLDFPQAIAVSPDGAHVYVAGFLDNALAVFDRDSSTGSLTFVESRIDGDGGVDGLEGAASVVVSGDGAHVYAGSFFDDAVAVFARDGATGALTFVEHLRDGVAGVDGLDGVDAVALSPDGAHLYTASEVDNAVAVFARDSSTGSLTFVESLHDGVDGVDGLAGAFFLAVADDGRSVYVASFADDAIAVFERDPGTGALTYVEDWRDGVAGVQGLDNATGLAVSPDGSGVYVAGVRDNAVTVFARHRISGKLSLIETHKDGAGGVDGLAGAFYVAASPDGRHLYAAGRLEDALAVFTVARVDTDQDGVRNTFDGDDDGDGIPDHVESAVGLDTLDPRTAGEDLDRDGASNLWEYRAGTGLGNALEIPVSRSGIHVPLPRTVVAPGLMAPGR